jgi:hypothetical protein
VTPQPTVDHRRPVTPAGVSNSHSPMIDSVGLRDVVAGTRWDPALPLLPDRPASGKVPE